MNHTPTSDHAMLEVRGLHKAYGATHALRGVSFDARAGEMVAVLGENGAGKSTLVKILAGVVRSDVGQVLVDGAALAVRSSRSALQHGIVLIPQELASVPALTVGENVVLGAWPHRMGVVTRSSIRAQARQYADLVGLDVPLDTAMRQLSLADAQLVEIAKALARHARVLLLDEPTAALSHGEVERLFHTLRRLRADGTVMLYVSHRLDEVIAQADRALVLRDGELVLDTSVVDTSKSALVATMVGGRELVRPARASAAAGVAAPTLSMQALGDRSGPLRDATLHVSAGEVVGLYGVRGSGHEAVVEVLSGTRPHASGTLTVGGRTVRPLRSPRQARRNGLQCIPADRKAQGLWLDHSVGHNAEYPQLPRVSRWGVVSRRAELRILSGLAASTRLRYRDGSQHIRQLSGGNQQKVFLGARIGVASEVLVLHEPTRGVDVHARADIHETLRATAAQGRAVLLASTDVEEMVAYCDRIYVFRTGAVVQEFAGAHTTPAAVVAAATGG